MHKTQPPQTTSNSNDRDTSVQISRKEKERLAEIAVDGLAAAQALKVGEFFGGAFWHADKAGLERYSIEWDAFVAGFVTALPENIHINSAGIITRLN